MFNGNRFKKKPLSEGEVAKNKFNAVKIKQNGITFDSKVELYFYNLLTEEGIEFEFQKTYILMEGFTYMHESVLPSKIIVDFLLPKHNVIADTKGMQDAKSKLQHKLLKNLLYQQGLMYRIVLPSTQKACRELIQQLKTGFVLSEPLTESAGTRRKNKLKKAGWIWSDGDWLFYGEDAYPVAHCSAAYIMNLPTFEFEELLIKHQ